MIKQLTTLVVFSIGFCCTFAQNTNWQNLDLQKDGYYGTSTEKAYAELLKNKKKGGRVIVAVIDGGVDVSHEDLKSAVWVNPREIPGNERDDDSNGYKDDINGWNFIGGAEGNVYYDNLELTRSIKEKKTFYDSLAYTKIPNSYLPGYQKYRKQKNDFDFRLLQAQTSVDRLKGLLPITEDLARRINKSEPTKEDFTNLSVQGKVEEEAKDVAVRNLSEGLTYSQFLKQMKEEYVHFKNQVDYALNIDFNSRTMVGDDYKNLKEKFYGNNDVCGPNAEHGTHVAGIIGADRTNSIGIHGIADWVSIMSIRVVPDGDERDKDVANAIVYAVDNGAKVINMSFGKPYSPEKNIVDLAVKYAQSKDVLIVHAAGNDDKNLDDTDNIFFPSRIYADSSGLAKAWIEVGASGFMDDSTLKATFSNYGRKTVDVFAPGVHIYSTIPGSHYEALDGTSMAAPVVSGIAALIREYYPDLTALEVKDIILQSISKVNHLVQISDEHGLSKKIPFSEICKTGGIVNTYNALLLAAKYKRHNN